jgi:hypothetical protein
MATVSIVHFTENLWKKLLIHICAIVAKHTVRNLLHIFQEEKRKYGLNKGQEMSKAIFLETSLPQKRPKYFDGSLP